MITSRITNGAQTTIPETVRTALGLGEGDTLAYRIDGDRVVVTRVSDGVAPAHDPFAAFDEWASPADRKAYGDL